jgi:hypothetical protein
MNNRREKPKIPEGRCKLEVGEMIQPGDLKWDINKKKWVEIAGAINKPVLQSQDGFYCR